jgi:hypothetical protein
VVLSFAACSTRPSSYSGSLPQIEVQSPVNTTVAWFKALNDQNASLALAHFVPADRGMMRWSQWGPPFNHLRCSLRAQTSGDQADVRCTFDDINDPDTGMSNVSFWDVYLQREPSGRWLINNYGQG